MPLFFIFVYNVYVLDLFVEENFSYSTHITLYNYAVNINLLLEKLSHPSKTSCIEHLSIAKQPFT
jgi:hypothetical protein